MLVFVMNVGMYYVDYSFVGFYVSDGEKVYDLVMVGGGGNFGMLLNGVFCVGGVCFYQVIESCVFKVVDL